MEEGVRVQLHSAKMGTSAKALGTRLLYILNPCNYDINHNITTFNSKKKGPCTYLTGLRLASHIFQLLLTALRVRLVTTLSHQ